MRKVCADFAVPLVILMTATAIIAVSGADLKTSSLFCIDGKWPTGEQQPWHFLYKLDRMPALVVAVSGLLAALAGVLNRERSRFIRPGLFLVLLLALGPGLMVNGIFKEYWGRPRPREVISFGGSKEFLHPWQKGISHNGRSFPSGHASAAFYLTAPYYIYRRTDRWRARWWLAGGVSFGLLMSVARLAQGGHFLSDNLWAWGMVHLMAVSLCYLMRLDRDDPSATT